MKILVSKWNKMVVMAAVVLMVTSIGIGTAFAAGAVRQDSEVYRFDTMADVGDAQLVRTNSGVSMSIRSSVGGELMDLFAGPLGPHFMPGDAVTNWFVIFNKPGECISAGGACGEADVRDALTGGPNLAMVDVGFATGHVTGPQWGAAAHLDEGDPSATMLGIGLMDSMAAEIHVVVRSHGQASNLAPGEVAEAISSLMGGCGTNICGDPQFAVFPPAP